MVVVVVAAAWCGDGESQNAMVGARFAAARTQFGGACGKPLCMAADLERREEEEEEDEAVEHVEQAPVRCPRPLVHTLRPEVQHDLSGSPEDCEARGEEGEGLRPAGGLFGWLGRSVGVGRFVGGAGPFNFRLLPAASKLQSATF